MLAKIQKFILYFMLIFYLAVPIVEFVFFTNNLIISNSFKEINETEIDISYKNMTNETKKIYDDFGNSYGYFHIFSILTLVILIFGISINIIMIVFVCKSIVEGAKLTVFCCLSCASAENLGSCVQNMTKYSMTNPLLIQCIISALALISKSAEMVYSKEARSRVKDEKDFSEVCEHMISNEKSIGIMIALLVIVICCTFAKYFLDKYYFNKKLIQNINIPMGINVPIS